LVTVITVASAPFAANIAAVIANQSSGFLLVIAITSLRMAKAALPSPKRNPHDRRLLAVRPTH
jgi:hypothetical protein